jgi:Intracellular proteinase inhibitor
LRHVSQNPGWLYAGSFEIRLFFRRLRGSGEYSPGVSSHPINEGVKAEMILSIHKPFILKHMATMACGFFLASVLSAQTPEYFPLEVGNTWLYKAITIVGTEPLQLSTTYQTMRVTGTERIEDRQYFQVSYFGRDVLLREDAPTGNVFVYDRDAGTESPWVSLGLPVGTSFSSSVDPCSPQGQIVSRTDDAAVPLGVFKDEVQVKFQNNCGDTGVTTQYYAPNVGLIRQDQSSFAGPVLYRLIYYRVGDRTGAVPEVSFTASIDSPAYVPGNLLGARLTLRNSGTDGLNLHFPSSQSFDLKILNDKGESVYMWSSDKSFAMVAHDEILGPGELTYGVTVPIERMPAGHYVLQVHLTTDPIAYSAQVAFDVLTPSGK